MNLPVNQLINGDALEILKTFPDNTFDLSIIDPPYNIGIDEWDKLKDYNNFSINWIKEIVRTTKPNKAMWIFGNQHSINIIKNILDNIPTIRFRSLIIWNKGGGIPNSNNFTNLHEQILYYIKIPDRKILQLFGEHIKKIRLKKGLSLKKIGELCNEIWYHRGGHLYFETGLSRPTVKQYFKLKEVLKLDNRFDIWLDSNFIFNIESVGVKWKYQRDKRNKRGWKNCGDVWNIPQLSGNFKERVKHPCQKPIKLIERIVKVSSNEKDIILDPFAGSGTTCLVAQKLGRNWIGIDLKKEYIEIAKKRLEPFMAEKLTKWSD